MVKKILPLVAALAAAFFLSTCSDGFVLTRLVPWYTPYVKDTISLPDLLPQAYKDKPVYARSISGASVSNPSQSVTWIVILQVRSPDANMVSILDSSFRPVYSVQDYRIAGNGNGNNPPGYFIDPNGHIQLGGIEIVPPAAGGSWKYIKSTLGTPQQNSDQPMVSVGLGSSGYIFQNSFMLTTASASQLSVSLGSFNSYYSSGVWNPYFYSSSSIPFNYTELFHGATAAPLPLPSITINSIRKDYSKPSGPVFEYYCTTGWSSSGPMVFPPASFLIRIPESSFDISSAASAATSPDLSNITPIILNTSGVSSSTNSGDSPQTTATSGGYVTILGTYNDSNSSSTQLPLVYTDSSGVQKASIVAPLSNYPSSGNSGSGSSNSSISQRPLPLDGYDDWLVADGLHGCVYRCSKWWQ